MNHEKSSLSQFIQIACGNPSTFARFLCFYLVATQICQMERAHRIWRHTPWLDIPQWHHQFDAQYKSIVQQNMSTVTVAWQVSQLRNPLFSISSRYWFHSKIFFLREICLVSILVFLTEIKRMARDFGSSMAFQLFHLLQTRIFLPYLWLLKYISVQTNQQKMHNSWFKRSIKWGGSFSRVAPEVLCMRLKWINPKYTCDLFFVTFIPTKINWYIKQRPWQYYSVRAGSIRSQYHRLDIWSVK